jgi:hypothetical protein
MAMDRTIRNTLTLVVNKYTFQTIMGFKYLGTNNKNNIHNEVKLRILVANKEYFGLEKLSIKQKIGYFIKIKCLQNNI